MGLRNKETPFARSTLWAAMEEMRLSPSSANAGRPRRGPRVTWRWALWQAVRIHLIAYLLILLWAMWSEESAIFQPVRYPEGDWRPAWLQFEDVQFSSEDGTALHGWYLEHPTPRAHVLYCYGNAGHLAGRAELVAFLRDRYRVSIFIFDYRGYGRSEGEPNEKGILADARAARAWLADQAGIDADQVVLMGRSLGGAVAVDLAADGGASGLILESTFTSMTDLAAHHYPFLPVRLLLRTRLDSVDKIGRYDGPLLQSHSPADEVVPYELGQRLFEASPSDQKRFVVIEGAAHNDPHRHPVFTEYYEALEPFFDQLVQENR